MIRCSYGRRPQRVAVVGAGPAGLAAAHRLTLLEPDVVLFEARAKLGGLNEYGLANKTTNGFAQKEVDWLLSIGGIEVRTGQVLGRDITVDGLVAAYDAVFLGLGLAGVNALGIAGNSWACVTQSISSPISGKRGISPKCGSAAAWSSSAAA